MSYLEDWKMQRSSLLLTVRQGYHCIALTEDSIPKTTFKSLLEKWEFVKSPFGLNQAPAYFMALINKVPWRMWGLCNELHGWYTDIQP